MEPIQVTIQAYRDAHNSGSFSEAAAKREQARSLLQRVPVDSPQFGMWVQNVAQLYEGAGKGVQARATLEDALSRAEALGPSHSTRILLLNSLADFWQQDRNLLKSLAYREKAAAATDAAPPAKSPEPAGEGQMRLGRAYTVFGINRRSVSGNNSWVYQRLAEIYQQLGRPDAAAAVWAKMRTVAKDDDAALASLYEQQGQLDEAAALYRKLAEQAEPSQRVGALQSLANLAQREERYGDATAALLQAISVLDTSGKPEARSQTISLRQNLAGVLNQAGQPQAADQVYQQLLNDTQDGQNGSYLQVLTSYANHLGNTKRGAEAEGLLNDYLANHSNLQPWEESNLLSSLAQAARMSGQAKRADEYQQAATKKQQAMQKASPEQVSIAGDLQKALSKANSNSDEAFNLAMQALDAASRAVDRDQVAWTVPSIANILANRKAPDKADQLYQRLFGLLQSWSADNQQPLLTVSENYPRFLMQQQNRWTEAPAAIEQYRQALVAARGAGAGWLEQPLQLTIEFERSHGSQGRALRAAQDLVALEELLDGPTSEPYLRATETLAGLFESGADPAQGLALRRQEVVIADLVFPSNSEQRGFIRLNAATALARQLQFDEAQRLASEAVVIGQSMRPPRAQLFIPQLQEIQRMKAVAQAANPAAARRPGTN